MTRTRLIAAMLSTVLCLTLTAVLYLSARVKSAAAATQASGLVALPLILVSYAQSSAGLIGSSNTHTQGESKREGAG